MNKRHDDLDIFKQFVGLAIVVGFLLVVTFVL